MEDRILKLGINKLKELQGVRCKIIKEEVSIGTEKIDAEVMLISRHRKFKYYVEVKNKIVPDQIQRILEKSEALEPLLVIANYITPKAKELLKLANIAYLDTAGNMYINSEDFYIYIETGKSNRGTLKKSSRAFKNAGSKVVYQLLINHPRFLNNPYREIGLKSTVTIDTVSKVFQDLLKQKLILQKNAKTFEFNDRKRLFEEWVRGFNQNTRPKLRQQRFNWVDENVNWRKINLPYDTYWGESNAAELLKENIIADRLLIYTGQAFQDVMKELRIIPDEHGEILLIEKFWSSINPTSNIVQPMLVYADLLHDTNPRFLKTANKIYKEYVEANL